MTNPSPADAKTRPTPLDQATSTGTGGATVKISVSLTNVERHNLEARSAELRAKGHRKLKLSRLARVAFRMLSDADDADILRVAETVEDLEARRIHRQDNRTTGQQDNRTTGE
jgi:hypothetical protein